MCAVYAVLTLQVQNGIIFLGDATMRLKNANLFGVLCDIEMEGGIFTKVGAIPGNGLDLQGKMVLPGLIDVHTHGCLGKDTMDADFYKMSDFLAKNGTTCYLPTTMTMPYDAISRVLLKNTDVPGAQIAGFHLEGPYISETYKGAQNAAYIAMPDIEAFRILNQKNNVKMITVAPELPGCMEFIRQAECVVSLGHTAADYDTCIDAILAGASCVTHACNAMPPLHHRAPSLMGAAVKKQIYIQVISDGLHLHGAMVYTLYRLFGPDKMILISDSMHATGYADGTYDFGGQPIVVKDGVARTQDGKLAGSTSTLWRCVKLSAAFGIPFADAVAMATRTPAALLGLNKGRIAVGLDADLIVIDSQMQVEMTVIAGEIYKGRE